jgi:hypothetical protein
MDPGLPERLRGHGRWTPLYEPGPIQRAIAWPFQILAALLRGVVWAAKKLDWLWHWAW